MVISIGILLSQLMNSKTAPATSNFRWVICALLFFSTTVNYMDRQVISYLKEFFCTPAAAGRFRLDELGFRQRHRHASPAFTRA